MQDEPLGEGTITLIIRDPTITIIGDMNFDYDDDEEAPLYGCKSLLHVNFKGCTKFTQLAMFVFRECSSLTSVALLDKLTQLHADDTGSLEVGLFLQKMNILGCDGEKGLVGYILKFV